MQIQDMPLKVNFSEGRKGAKLEFIVLHISTEDKIWGIGTWFCDPVSSTSFNYMIKKDGSVLHCVNDMDTPWTNGLTTNMTDSNPIWAAHPGEDANKYSLTVELVGRSGDRLPPVQYDSLICLLKWLTTKYNIQRDRRHIIGHCEIDPVNMTACPGPGVDLDKIVSDLLKPTVSIA